uniref:Uncharacterized protein n=1 Tax=Oryza punctata TaxID=4537 RepID=A0A0E0LJH7_ORYPU
MGKNTMGPSNSSEDTKESMEQLKGKQDSFAGTTKNDYIDHSLLESSSMLNLEKQDEPDKVEILAKATKDVPEELETIETKSMNLVKKTSRNVGKRTRQDNGGSKKEKSSDHNLQGQGMDRSVKGRTMETTPGPTQYPRGRGPTRGNLPYGFV